MREKLCVKNPVFLIWLLFPGINTWSNATPTVLNARISEGVFAALIEPAPEHYESQITALNPQFISPCD